MDLQGWHLVFWQAETGNYWPDGCEVSDADLEWLRADLSAASLPCIVCSHLPLGPCAMHGNYYFQNNPRFARYGRDKEIRAVLESSAKVVLCLAGHTHWNRYQVHSNITYVSLQSLTESFTTFPDPAGARAWMELESDRGCLRVYGRDWLEIVFPLQCESRPWVKPLKSFDRRAKEPSLQNEAKLRALGAVLFDLDGVFYQGEHPLPGGAWLLSLLRRMGLPFMALTNNARKPPSFYSQRLAAMGVDFPARLILTSAEVAAAYLAQEETGSVFVIGSPWLEECVQRQGLKIDARDVEVVLAGMEENLTLEDLAWACLQVRSGARLVVTNPDRSLPTPEGRIPSAGALQAYLETASGYKAQIIGKPARFMFEQAVKTLGVDPRATLMVGDTWDTDILGAKQAGLQTAFLGDLSEGAKDVELAAPDLKCLTELLLQKGVLG
jgi:4-nitrophenyl phosphatase